MRDRKPGKLVIMMGILAGILVIAIFGRTLYTQALFDSSQAAHVDPDTIENSTLIIGTHLIHLSALNDTNFAIAKESAAEANQNKMYYKSELSSGMWYCIDDAGSVKDITTEGTIVDKDEIRALPLTHHTKSDGITYDLRTGNSVCIFNINLVDAYNMDELEPIKNQNQLMSEANKKSDSDNEHMKMIAEFFNGGLPEGFNSDYTEQINALQSYYEQLVGNNAPAEESANVMKIMEKINNARTASTCELMEARLGVLEQKAIGKKVFYDYQDPEEDDYDPSEELELNDALMSAIADAKSAISEKKLSAQSNMITEGSNVLSSKEYQFTMDMVNGAKAGNYAACDVANGKLIDLDHISAGKIAQKDSELSLSEELITAADNEYRQALSTGVTLTYSQMSDKNMSHAALENCIKQDMNPVNAARAEMQFMIQSKIDRLDNKTAQDYVMQRLNTVVDFRRNIPADAYKDAANATVDIYNEWLSELLATLKKGSDENTSTDSLYEKKQQLLEEKLNAIDNLNLDTVKKIDASIEDIDKQISAIENAKEAEMAAFLDQKNRLEKNLSDNPTDETAMIQLDAINSKLAELNASAADDSQAANINSIKGEVNNLIRSGDTSQTAINTIKSGMEGLKGALDNGSALALEALNEISQNIDKSVDKDAFKEISNDIKKTISKVDADALSNKGTNGSAQKTEQIVENKKKAMDALESKSTDASTMNDLKKALKELEDAVDGGSTLALSALQDAYEDMVEKQLMDNMSEYNELIKELEEKIAEAPTTAVLVSEMTLSQCINALKESQANVAMTSDGNISLTGAETKQQIQDCVAATIAVTEYADMTNNAELKDMSKKMANSLANVSGANVYKTFSNIHGQYAPADVVAKCIGYNYLWNDTRRSATLSRGATYYEFTSFETKVLLKDGQEEYMNHEAQFFEKTVYIEDSYLQSRFGIRIVDISGTDFSALVNDKVIERSQELSSELLEKGGV